MGYRAAMAAPDDPADQPQGLSIDIGDILKDLTKPRRRTTRRTSTRSTGDMDAAIRRAIRVELADVERALRQLADEVVRLRRANEDLAAKVDRAIRR